MHRRAVLAAVSVALVAGCTSRSDDGDDEIGGHGNIEVVVDGNPVDLSEDRFQAEHAENHSVSFHLHEHDDQWYTEGEQVTFAEGIDRLPYFEYDNSNGDHVVTIDGTTYDSGDPGTEVTFAVDGEEVDPAEHALRDGDDLRLEVTTGD